MFRSIASLPVLAVLTLLPIVSVTSARAGVLTINVDGQGSSLGGLQVGDKVTVDLLLSLMDGESGLRALGAVVQVPTNFSAPSNATAGPIVSNPDLSLSLNVPVPSMGTQFVPVVGGGIDGSGVFYSFDLTAVAPGSGTISLLQFPSIAIDEDWNIDFGVAGGEVEFTILEPSVGPEGESGGQGAEGPLGSVESMPEPASVAMFVVIALVAGGLSLRRGRVRPGLVMSA